jgi:hypothetical protein
MARDKSSTSTPADERSALIQSDEAVNQIEHSAASSVAFYVGGLLSSIGIVLGLAYLCDKFDDSEEDPDRLHILGVSSLSLLAIGVSFIGVFRCQPSQDISSNSTVQPNLFNSEAGDATPEDNLHDSTATNS